MRFRIGKQIYTAASLTKPSIKDFLKLENETAALGRRMTSSGVIALAQEIGELKTDKERSEHPDMLLMLALTMWATLAVAGEPDAWDRAISVSMDDLEFLDDPEDHKPAADPQKARARSARAAKRPTNRPTPELTTSTETSTPDS